MKSDTVSIRFARSTDAPALQAIYAPYVAHTAITFEYEAPSAAVFAQRMEQIQRAYPYLVAEYDGTCCAYAYAAAFKERSAYDWAVETSIYIAAKQRGMGIGKRLYEALEDVLRLQGVTNLNACIAAPAASQDPYLSDASIRFHERMGYRLIGTFHQCGYKFERWYDMVWMEKHIMPHQTPQPPVRSIQAIYEQAQKQLASYAALPVSASNAPI